MINVYCGPTRISFDNSREASYDLISTDRQIDRHRYVFLYIDAFTFIV